jgi:sec-independent protein translocase protein TatC
MTNNDKPIVIFLIELRTRLIYSLIVFFVILSVLLLYANQLYTFLATPLLKILPQGHLIATQILSPFFVPFKLAFMVSFLAATPFFLYQLWIFISPALYLHERSLVWPSLFLSIILFYAGIAFAYFFIFPALFYFLANTAPPGIVVSPDISDYLDFTMRLLFIFGGLFEIPMLMVLLTALNVIMRERFSAYRPYAFICAFIIGMLFAPPDILSQTILAIPIYLLYEIGILAIRFVVK